jgi:hypothetical protein
MDLAKRGESTVKVSNSPPSPQTLMPNLALYKKKRSF